MFYTVPFHSNIRTGAVDALIDPARIVAASGVARGGGIGQLPST